MKVRFSLLVLLAALVFAITFSAVGMKGKKVKMRELQSLEECENRQKYEN